MKFVIPRMGVLAAICCWASAAHAAGMPAVDTEGVSPAAAREVYATKASVGEPVSVNVAFAGIADQSASSLDVNLQTLALLPRAKAFGVGPQLGALAAAWNDALAADLAALPGLHSIQTAEVRRQFVNAPGVYGLFNVEEACLAVGCMTEFALSPQTPEGEVFAMSNVKNNVLQLMNPATVVPVPPALLLFGSALGLLSWVRRRAA